MSIATPTSIASNGGIVVKSEPGLVATGFIATHDGRPVDRAPGPFQPRLVPDPTLPLPAAPGVTTRAIRNGQLAWRMAYSNASAGTDNGTDIDVDNAGAGDDNAATSPRGQWQGGAKAELEVQYDQAGAPQVDLVDTDAIWSGSAYESAIPRSLPFLGIPRRLGAADGETVRMVGDARHLADIARAVPIYLQYISPLAPLLTYENLMSLAQTSLDGSVVGPDGINPQLRASVIALSLVPEWLAKPGPPLADPLPALDAVMLIPPLVSPTGEHGMGDMMIAIHQFIGYSALGQTFKAWRQLQDAITMVTVFCETMGEKFRYEDYLYRLYTWLYLAERACVLYQQHPSWINHPLRLPDDTFTSTPFSPKAFEPAILRNYPVLELRTCSIIRSFHYECWKGTCLGVVCGGWPVDFAVQVIAALDGDLQTVRSHWEETKDRSNEGVTANFAMTVAWMRDRLWNIFYRHGLIYPGGPFSLKDIVSNTDEIVAFCRQVNPEDVDIMIDWDVKLFDIAETALAAMEIIPREGDMFKSLLGSVNDVLEILGEIGAGDGDYGQEIREDLAALL